MKVTNQQSMSHPDTTLQSLPVFWSVNLEACLQLAIHLIGLLQLFIILILVNQFS